MRIPIKNYYFFHNNVFHTPFKAHFMLSTATQLKLYKFSSEWKGTGTVQLGSLHKTIFSERNYAATQQNKKGMQQIVYYAFSQH
jgi:hypothetical protein